MLRHCPQTRQPTSAPMLLALPLPNQQLTSACCNLSCPLQLHQGFAGDRHAGTKEEEELSPRSQFQRDLRIRRLRASRSYQPDPIPSLDPEPEPSEDHGEEKDEPLNEPLWRCLDFGEEPVAHAERDLASVLGNGTLAAWLAGCPEDLQRSVTAQVRGELGLLWHAAMACEAMWGSGGVSAGRQRKEEEEEEQEEEVQAEEDEEVLFSTDEDGEWTSIPGSEDEDEEPRNDDDNGPWSSSRDEGLRDSSYDDEQQFDEEAAAGAGAAGGYRADAAPEQGEPRAALAMTSSGAIESFKRNATDLYSKCQKFLQRTGPGSDAAPEQEMPRAALPKMSSKEMAAHFNRKALWFQAYIRTQERQESTQRTLQRTRGAGQPQGLEDPPSFFVESEAGVPVSRSPWVSAQRSLPCDNEEVEVPTSIPAESEAGFQQQQQQQQPPVEQPAGPSRTCAPEAEPDVQTRRILPFKYDNKQQSASQHCFTPEANHPSGEPNRRPEAHICTTSLFWLSQAGRHRRMCSGASGGRPLVGVSRHERQRDGADGSWCRSGTARGMKQPPTTPRWLSTC